MSGEIQTTCWECPKCGVTLTSKTAKDHVCMSEHGSASTLIEPTTGERKPVNTDMGKNTGPGMSDTERARGTLAAARGE